MNARTRRPAFWRLATLLLAAQPLLAGIASAAPLPCHCSPTSMSSPATWTSATPTSARKTARW